MSSWITRVEWITPDLYDEPALDLVMEHLQGHDPAVALEHSAGGSAAERAIAKTAGGSAAERAIAKTAGGSAAERAIAARHTYSATVTVEANTLRQAIAAGLDLVAGATGETLVGVEALPQPVHDLRVDVPTIPDLVGYAEIADMLGVTRQRAREIATTNTTFPVAVVETKSGPLRTRRAVKAWASNWERKSGRPAKRTEESDS